MRKRKNKIILLVVAMLIIIAIILCIVIPKGEDNSGSNESTDSGIKSQSEWPDADYIKDYMKYEGGKINEVSDTDNGYIVRMTEVTKKDFNDYIAKLKKKGIDFYKLQGMNEENWISNNSWYGSNKKVYIMLNFYEGEAAKNQGYNLQVTIYNAKPLNW